MKKHYRVDTKKVLIGQDTRLAPRAPSATGYDWQTEGHIRAIVALRAKLPAPPR